MSVLPAQERSSKLNSPSNTMERNDDFSLSFSLSNCLAPSKDRLQFTMLQANPCLWLSCLESLGTFRPSCRHSLIQRLSAPALAGITRKFWKCLHPKPIHSRTSEGGDLALICLGNSTGDCIVQPVRGNCQAVFPPVCGPLERQVALSLMGQRVRTLVFPASSIRHS